MAAPAPDGGYDIVVPDWARPGQQITVQIPGVAGPLALTLPAACQPGQRIPIRVAQPVTSATLTPTTTPKVEGGAAPHNEFPAPPPPPTTPPPAPPPAPRAEGQYGEADEIALRELLVQRCLELSRNPRLTWADMRSTISAEFGQARFARYKDLVMGYMPKAEGMIELPRLVACVAGCGFWGKPATKNLCGKCFQHVVQKGAAQISEQEAVASLLSRLGFQTLDDYKLDLAFTRAFPAEAADDAVRNALPGVRQWVNSARPLTQFDKVPEKGSTACTYISGLTALRALLRREYAKDPPEWADCIRRGVRAFHVAGRADDRLKGHSHIMEALPYVLEMLGYAQHDARTLVVEEVVVLLHKVPALGDKPINEVLGEKYASMVGTAGLVPTLRRALEASSAVVVTRPPETWAVTLERGRGESVGQDKTDGSSELNGKVRLRDSHRLAQLDFDDLGAFLSWVAVDRAFFAAVPSTGVEMNSVSISWFRKKTAEDLAHEREQQNARAQAQALARQRGDTIVAQPVVAGGGAGESKEGIPVAEEEDEEDYAIVEVIPRLFLSSYKAATSLPHLLQAGITHILNVSPPSTHVSGNAAGQVPPPPPPALVPSCVNMFPADFRYCNATVSVPARAHPDRLRRLLLAGFEKSGRFIRQALATSSVQRVLVHCDSGVSLSPTTVMAYMIQYMGRSLATAYKTVQRKRPQACPSDTLFRHLLMPLELQCTSGGMNTMDADERAADIICQGVLSGFPNAPSRDRVLAQVKRLGLVRAQQILLDEALGVRGEAPQ